MENEFVCLTGRRGLGGYFSDDKICSKMPSGRAVLTILRFFKMSEPRGHGRINFII